MRIFLLINLLLMLVGCNSEYADLSPLRKTRINVRPTLPTGIFASNIMMWGKSSGGGAFARTLQQDQQSTFILPNGNYTLYTIAWTGPNLTGDVYCSTTPTTFSGPDLPIELSLTNVNCDLSHFRGDDPSVSDPVAFGNTTVQWCESLNAITGSSDTCSDDLVIPSPRKAARGHAMSYRFVLSSFDKRGSSYSLHSESVTSLCLKGTPAVGSELEGLAEGFMNQLPTGDGSTTPFHIQLQAFPGSLICDDSVHGMKTVTLENGLKKDSSALKYIAAGVTLHQLYVKMSSSEVCTTKANSKTFAGGDGTREAPYLICNETQFYNTRTTETSSFKLMSDIDLTKYYYGKTPLPNIPDNLTCLEKGSNFFPLGYDGTCTANANIFATNDFDGGGKTIKGMRIFMPNHDRVGMYIRKNGGEIRRLNIKDFHIKGNEYVGALTALTRTFMTEVKADNITVNAKSSVAGGLVGGNGAHPSDCVFRNIRVNKVNVVGGSSFNGGVVGQSNSCEFYNVSVSGHVYGTYANTGGIAGNLTNSVADKVSFSGLVRGSHVVGGITGDVLTSLVSNSYVEGSVLGTSNGPNVRAGGLVGYTNGAPDATSGITDSYFFGQMNHYCTAVPIANCGVSNIVGDPGGWAAGSLSSNAYISTNRTTGYAAYDSGTSRPLTDFFSTAAVWPAAFSKSLTDLPRLNHEVTASSIDLRHPCRANPMATETVENQIENGYGTLTNPISICHFSQLKDMQFNATHAAKNYKLLNFVLGTEELSPSTLAFSGQLDGDSKGIVRLVVKGTAGEDVAWWKELSSSAVLKNLYIIDSRIIDQGDSALTTALIAKTNYGLMDGVYSFATRSTPGPLGEHSLFVHTNAGKISNSFIGGSATVRVRFGSAAFENLGTIEDSWISSYVACNSAFACNTISGLAVRNDGIIRRIDLTATLVENVGFGSNVNLSFITSANRGLIEDIHISSSSSITAKSPAAHAIRRNGENSTVRRIYNEGRVTVYNGTLPSLNPTTSSEYVDNATNTVGYSEGTVSHIAYKYVPRWSYPAQYNYVSRSVAGGVQCNYTLGGGVNGDWESAMLSGLYTRFGIMVTLTEPTYQFTSIPTLTAGDDIFYIFDQTPCSMTVGNPTVYFIPFDQYNGDQNINQSESLMYSTFSDWSGVNDVTTDSSVIHNYEYNQVRGTSSSKPVWIFDTTNSLRLYR